MKGQEGTGPDDGERIYQVDEVNYGGTNLGSD